MEENPVDLFFDELDALDSFVHCSLEGFGYATVAQKAIDALRKHGSKKNPNRYMDDKFYDYHKKHYENLSEFANIEINKGHPFLFSIASIRLSSILEAASIHITCLLLKDQNRVINNEKLNALKGPLVEFIKASEEERVLYLKDLLIQNLNAPLKIGVGKLEAPINELGLDGSVTENVRKVILELSEVRNLYVHKLGYVDDHFLKRCPWIKNKIGEKRLINSENYRAYYLACIWYLVELDQRYIEAYGKDKKREENAGEFLNELENDLSNYLINK